MSRRYRTTAKSALPGRFDGSEIVRSGAILMKINQLTEPQLNQLYDKPNPSGKPYKLTDGAGLFAYITTKGTISFRYHYRFNGKQKTYCFGIYPTVSLEDARIQLLEVKTRLKRGQDPSLDKPFSQRRKKRAHGIIRLKGNTKPASLTS
jgi:hypothetical protein